MTSHIILFSNLRSIMWEYIWQSLSKKQAITNSLNLIMDYIPKVKKIIPIEELAFIHKLTKSKLEIAIYFELNKNWSTVEKLYKNIDSIIVPNNLINGKKQPYLFAELAKKSTTKQTEGKKVCLKHNNSFWLFRPYKMVNLTYGKIEITKILEKEWILDLEKSTKQWVKLLKKATKWIEQSLKPFYFQSGTEFTPLNKVLKK